MQLGQHQRRVERADRGDLHVHSWRQVQRGGLPPPHSLRRQDPSQVVRHRQQASQPRHGPLGFAWRRRDGRRWLLHGAGQRSGDHALQEGDSSAQAWGEQVHTREYRAVTQHAIITNASATTTTTPPQATTHSWKRMCLTLSRNWAAMGAIVTAPKRQMSMKTAGPTQLHRRSLAPMDRNRDDTEMSPREAHRHSSCSLEPQ